MQGDAGQDDSAPGTARSGTGRLLRYGIPALLLLLLIGAVTLFAHSEPSAVPRGSLGFHLGIPGTAKQLPVRDDCAPAEYSYTARDGERIGMARVGYGSTLSEADLQALYAQHYQDRGCTPEEGGHRCPDGNFHETRIDPAPADQCRRIDLIILGDFE